MKQNFIIISLALLCQSCTAPMNITGLFDSSPSIFMCILWIVWAALIARRAGKYSRNRFLWFVIALCITPIVSWIILEIMGQEKGNGIQNINDNLEETINSIKKKPANPLGCAILVFIVGFVVVVLFNLAEAVSRGLDESQAYGDNDAITRNTNSVYLSALFFATIIAIIVYALQKAKKDVDSKYKRTDIIPQWKQDEVKTENSVKPEDVKWQNNTKSAKARENYMNQDWEESIPTENFELKKTIEKQSVIDNQTVAKTGDNISQFISKNLLEIDEKISSQSNASWSKKVFTRQMKISFGQFFFEPFQYLFLEYFKKRVLDPFKKLTLGYYRLFLVGWLVFPIVVSAITYTVTYFIFLHHRYLRADKASENSHIWFFIAVLAYYPIMRIVLWVRDGFEQNEKSKDQT
jgi:hypothetical protein